MPREPVRDEIDLLDADGWDVPRRLTRDEWFVVGGPDWRRHSRLLDDMEEEI